MSKLDNTKAEAERVVNEMRSSADKVRENIATTFNQSGNSYSYSKIIPQLRLGQLVALPIQALALYLEAGRIGLLGFLIPFSLICANFYLTLTKFQQKRDGRSDAQTLVNSKNTQTKTQAGIQVFGGFLLALLVHFVSPRASTSMLGSLVFNLADYLIIVAAFVCVGLDLYEGLKNKSR